MSDQECYSGFRLDNGEKIYGPLDIDPAKGCFINGIQINEEKPILLIQPTDNA
jgi:hypothetical protein